MSRYRYKGKVPMELPGKNKRVKKGDVVDFGKGERPTPPEDWERMTKKLSIDKEELDKKKVKKNGGKRNG